MRSVKVKWNRRRGCVYFFRIEGTDIYKVGQTVQTPEMRVYGLNKPRSEVRKCRKYKPEKIIVMVIPCRTAEHALWLETKIKKDIKHLLVQGVECFKATPKQFENIKARINIYMENMYTKETHAEIRSRFKSREQSRRYDREWMNKFRESLKLKDKK